MQKCRVCAYYLFMRSDTGTFLFRQLDVRAIFGAKWKSEIICVPAAKNTLRYGQIRKEMYNSKDAVFEATRKEMITDEVAEGENAMTQCQKCDHAGGRG